MTLQEYKDGLYFGVLSIDSEADCYGIERDGRTDIEMIKILVMTASSCNDYIGGVIDDYTDL